MSMVVLITTIGTGQLIFFVFVIGFLVANRVRTTRQNRNAKDAAHRLAEPIRAWAVGEAGVEDLVTALRDVPRKAALEHLSLHFALRASPAQRDEMAQQLRDESWVKETIAESTSRQWFRRLDAARVLTIVGSAEHRPIIVPLLEDVHPAVQAAASHAVPRVADNAMIDTMLDKLPRRSEFLRRYQYAALQQTWRLSYPALRQRLSANAPAESLTTWIDLANYVADPASIVAAAAHASHQSADVRLAVADACKHYFSDDAHPLLLKLLSDEDPRVRAKAATALASIRAHGTVPALAFALADPAWSVRLQAGLALAQLGEPGRVALIRTRDMGDRFAAEMSRLVSGLSSSALRELAEA